MNGSIAMMRGLLGVVAASVAAIAFLPSATLATVSYASVQQAPVAKPEAYKKLEALNERLEKARSDFMEQLRAEKDAAARNKLFEKRPGAEFLAEFKALAAESKGTDVAANCWMQVAQLGLETDKTQETKAACDALIADHLASVAIDGLPGIMGQMAFGDEREQARKTLQTLLEKSPRKEVQAGALFELGSMGLRHGVDAAQQAEARKNFERLAKDYAGIKSPYGQEYKALAEGYLYELDHLQIGQVAPDFEVTDENGVKFKLSDYRGKVVVLDFWGFW